MAGRGRGATLPAWMTVAQAQNTSGTVLPSIQPAQTTASQDMMSASKWSEHRAPDGRSYYYNSITGQSVWEKPDELLPPSQRADPSDQWKEYSAPDGRKYYYNKYTGESRWQKPSVMVNAGLQSDGQQKVVVVAQQLITRDSNGHQADHNHTPVTAASDAAPGTDASTGEAAKSGNIYKEQSQQGGSAGSKKSVDIEKGKEEFQQLLRSVGMKSDWTWEQTMRLIINDKRYGRLPSLDMKKKVFKELADQLKDEEKNAASVERKERRKKFLQLLQEQVESEGGVGGLRREILKRDDRWYAVESEGERQDLMDKFVREEEEKERDKRRQQRKQAVAMFIELLKRESSINHDTSWRKASELLKGKPEYEEMDRTDRITIFEDYVAELVKKHAEKEAIQKERKKNKDKHDREAFVELLQLLCDQGEITALTHWSNIKPKLKQQVEYGYIKDHADGTRPKDLFREFQAELVAAYHKDKEKLTGIHSMDAILSSMSDWMQFKTCLRDQHAADVAQVSDTHMQLYYEERTKQIKQDKHELKKMIRKYLEQDNMNLYQVRQLLESHPMVVKLGQREIDKLFNKMEEKLKIDEGVEEEGEVLKQKQRQSQHETNQIAANGNTSNFDTLSSRSGETNSQGKEKSSRSRKSKKRKKEKRDSKDKYKDDEKERKSKKRKRREKSGGSSKLRSAES